VAPDFRDAGGGDGALGGPVGGPEPALRGGGLPLPGLKHWRLRKGMSQTQLARRADLKDGYVARVESGRRGCNPETAQRLADLLKVDLQDLRRNYEDAPEKGEKGAQPGPARPRIAYRHVHQAYLRIVLEGAVGSARGGATARAAFGVSAPVSAGPLVGPQGRRWYNPPGGPGGKVCPNPDLGGRGCTAPPFR
jgi:transcriptional regulator with XRE-family HTH domain